MLNYPVTLTRDSNGSFLVGFPDFPEANSVGDTVEEALHEAVDAYCLSNTNTLFDSSPRAVVTFIFEVSVLPSLETVREVVPTALPPRFNVKLAV